MDTIRLRATAQLMASAMSPNSWPTSSFMKMIGTKTAMVVAVLASTAPQTSRAPSSAAFSRHFPICRWR